MALHKLSTGLLLVLLTALQMGGRRAAHLDISPDRFNDLGGQAIAISCLPDEEDTNVKEIVLLELSKGRDNTIVSIGRGSPLKYTGGNQTRYKPTGHIDNNIVGSYLNFTLLTPKAGDEGTYTCKVLTMDKTGVIKERKVSNSLKHENLYLSKEDGLLLKRISYLEEQLAKTNSMLEKRIVGLEGRTTDGKNSLNEKVSMLETRIDDLDGSTAKKINSLTDKDSALEKRMKGLENSTAVDLDSVVDKVSVLETKVNTTHNQPTKEVLRIIKKGDYSNLAFSATSKKQHYTPVSGDVLLFPDVIISMGIGYNESSGVFTAPVSGLFVFHVVVRVSSSSCNFQLDLMTNDQVLSRLSAYNKNSYPQASISSVADLNTGDRVYCKVVYGGCVMDYEHYSLFTGYLI